MPHNVLTEEQVQVLAQAGGPVEARDSQGRTLACLTPFDLAALELIARSRQSVAAGGPRVPSHQVQAHLQKLAEISQGKELDEARLLELLRRMRAGTAR
jgi:hypothetical protein